MCISTIITNSEQVQMQPVAFETVQHFTNVIVLNQRRQFLQKKKE